MSASGGSTIFCDGFDAGLFWDVLERPDSPVTWYYAAPTLHHLILQEHRARFGRNHCATHIR